MIKFVSLALALACAVKGADRVPQLIIRIEGEPLLGCKVLQQAFGSIGVHSEISRFTSDGTISQIEINLSGKKGYDPKRFMGMLKEHSAHVLMSKYENQQWHFDIDMRQALLDIPKINDDSSSQMQRSIYPYWFDVEGARYITIDAPYEGLWYPEIAVFDAGMQVLHSSKQTHAQARMAFELPDGSKYLKVSNSHGMHLLKEGLWISAEQNEN